MQMKYLTHKHTRTKKPTLQTSCATSYRYYKPQPEEDTIAIHNGTSLPRQPPLPLSSLDYSSLIRKEAELPGRGPDHRGGLEQSMRPRRPGRIRPRPEGVLEGVLRDRAK